MNIGILGGSFSPPHIGHMQLAQLALSNGMDQTWLMPCFKHLTKQPIDADHRYKMCVLATKNRNNIFVSRFEIDNELQNGTYEMLDLLKKKHPEHIFHFIIGTDNAATINTWRNSYKLLKENNFIIIKRQREALFSWDFPSYKYIECQLSDVSSTEIRKAIKENNFNNLDWQLDSKVLDYIKENNLYLEKT